jgi:hypothetical protein
MKIAIITGFQSYISQTKPVARADRAHFMNQTKGGCNEKKNELGADDCHDIYVYIYSGNNIICWE